MKIAFLILIGIFCISPVQAEETEKQIPKVYFYGDINGMTEKSDVRNIELKYMSEDLTFTSYATIKVQGDSSLIYEKKNYNISLYQDSEHTTKNKIDLKWGKMNKYTLKANWIDKTHSRNIVSARIATQMQKKYGLFTNHISNGLVDGFPVEIYINDEFLGLYTWNIHKDYLFETEDENLNYIVLSGKEHTDVTNFKKEADNTWNDFEVEVGEENDETLDKLNRLINFVNNSTDEEFKNEFENYFNLDSVLNYYCFMRYSQLVDNRAKNLVLITYDGNIWYTALYDLDTSWGTSWNGEELLNSRDSMSYEIQNSRLWSRLEQNFPNHIVVRYNELRNNILTEENIMKEFNSFYNLIPESSLAMEQAKYINIPGYELSTIEIFLKIRTPIIDREINSLKNDEYENVYNSFSLEKRNNKENEQIEKSPKDNNSKNYIIFIAIAIFVIIFCTIVLILLKKRKQLKTISN